MLIDHPALKSLNFHLQTYLIKGLTGMSTGENRFEATAVEIYAENVFEKVSELDGSLESMRLAIFFILDLTSEPNPETKVYRYHYENFLLRLSGIVDRSYRLVGVSMLLEQNKFEKIGGNVFVTRSLGQSHPDIRRCLLRLETVFSSKKALRNDIAHSKEFSSRELGLFSALERLEYSSAGNAKTLMADYFSEGRIELESLITDASASLEQLLDALKPILEDARRKCV